MIFEEPNPNDALSDGTDDGGRGEWVLRRHDAFIRQVPGHVYAGLLKRRFLRQGWQVEASEREKNVFGKKEGGGNVFVKVARVTRKGLEVVGLGCGKGEVRVGVIRAVKPVKVRNRGNCKAIKEARQAAGGGQERRTVAHPQRIAARSSFIALQHLGIAAMRWWRSRTVEATRHHRARRCARQQRQDHTRVVLRRGGGGGHASWVGGHSAR